MTTLQEIVGEWKAKLAAGSDAFVEALAMDLAVSAPERVAQLRRAAALFDMLELDPASRAEISKVAARVSRTGSTLSLERRNADATEQEQRLEAELAAGGPMARVDAVMTEVRRLEHEVTQLTAERDRLAACLAAVEVALTGGPAHG